MKNTIFLVLVLITMAACKNNTKTDEQTATTKENTVKKEIKNPILETGCYEYNNNGNTIKMEITELNENVKGNLDIAYAEKDANNGSFIGTLNGDKLIGIYTFNSEGTESIREIAFLVKDNQLVEGFGELNENDTKFKDVNLIQYTSSMPLTKVDCNK